MKDQTNILYIPSTVDQSHLDDKMAYFINYLYTYPFKYKERIKSQVSAKNNKNLNVGLENKIDQPDFKSEDIDKMLGLSKSQTYRKIKSLTGIAPNQLIQEFRLRKSLKCLKQSDATIAEIAYELGFNSPTYFAKVFRKRFDITPTYFTKISKTKW